MEQDITQEQSPPLAPLEQTKKVPPKGTLERRQYDKNAKQRSRLKAKQALGSQIPTAGEYRDEFPKQHPAQKTELDEYVKEFAETVLSELRLHYSTYAVDACLDQVARTSLGLKNNWVKDVQEPSGQLIAGMYFADSLGELIVSDAHRYRLEQSHTFSATYRELLTILDKKYGHENTKDARAIKAELNGTYVIPVPVEPQPAPEPAPPALPSRLPSDAEILERGRIQLLESLHLDPSARQYLYGGGR